MSGDQSIFAHYIFMDNEFSLPTASGFPLKFALSGTFAPGVEGGLRMEPGRVLNIANDCFLFSIQIMYKKMYNKLFSFHLFIVMCITNVSLFLFTG